MKWILVCRDCKKQYPESGEGLQESVNPSGHPLWLCTFGGVVDLCLVDNSREPQPAHYVGREE